MAFPKDNENNNPAVDTAGNASVAFGDHTVGSGNVQASPENFQSIGSLKGAGENHGDVSAKIAFIQQAQAKLLELKAKHPNINIDSTAFQDPTQFVNNPGMLDTILSSLRVEVSESVLEGYNDPEAGLSDVEKAEKRGFMGKTIEFIGKSLGIEVPEALKSHKNHGVQHNTPAGENLMEGIGQFVPGAAISGAAAHERFQAAGAVKGHK